MLDIRFVWRCEAGREQDIRAAVGSRAGLPYLFRAPRRFVVILLCGGRKGSQRRDIERAKQVAERMATGDLDVITAALGIVARARGMTELAQKTGLTRSALYTALREGGNPTLDTVLKVVKALGVQLKADRAA